MMGYKIILVGAMLFLSFGASADILVQPGYGQPHSVVQPYASTQHTVVEQPSSTLHVNNPYQLSSLAHGQSVAPYYLEVQPVYHDQTQAQSQIVGYPHSYHPHSSPFPPRYPSNHHLHYAKIGGYKVVKPSVFVGQAQVPLAVHNRRRRSITDQRSNTGGETTKINSNDVAKDSALTGNLSPIAFAGNQDNEHTKDLNDKYLEQRQSKSDRDVTGATLLGLNPEKMYPGHHQYIPEDDSHQSQTRHIASRHKSHHGSHENVGQQMRSHQPQEISVPEQNIDDQNVAIASPEPQLGSGTTNWRVITPDGQMLELSPTSLRNFPDPRPPKISKDKLGQMARTAEVNNNDPLNSDVIVGTSRHHSKLHKLKHQHPLPIVAPPATSYAQYQVVQPFTNCGCPSYTPTSNYMILKNNADCSNGLEVMQTTAQTPSSLYQISYVPQTSAVPNMNYMVVPQSNSECNTLVNYGTSSPLTYYI